MPEKSQQEKDSGRLSRKKAEKLSEKENAKGTWAQDQREKNYYYDDAHGYELYNPNEDDEEED